MTPAAVDDAGLVGLDDIRDAARLLDGVVVRTPLLDAPWLDAELGAPVRLKCENTQRAGAFKIRGAHTAIARLTADVRRRGVITYSSGNHAQAVALAASLFGVPATVVMPTTAPAIKADGARRLGAEVLFEGTTSTERRRRAEAVAAERGLTMIPPFDHPDIIAGQGTVGLEILRDAPDLGAIFVPVGGGGLLAGVAAAVKRLRPDCRVVGVEPAGADAMRRSIVAREPVTLDAVRTIADGLAPVRPGDLTFAHTAALVDDIVTVDDDDIRNAASALFHNARLAVELSGAAALAALLARRVPVHPRGSAVVLSGGNVDPALLASLPPVWFETR